MRHLGVLCARQVGDGAGHLEGAVRGAGRPPQPGGSRLQKLQRCGLQQGMDAQVMLQDDALQFLQRAANRLGWSARSTHRAMKVARTIADLAGATHTGADHVAEAVQLRRGLHHTQH